MVILYVRVQMFNWPEGLKLHLVPWPSEGTVRVLNKVYTESLCLKCSFSVLQLHCYTQGGGKIMDKVPNSEEKCVVFGVMQNVCK